MKEAYHQLLQPVRLSGKGSTEIMKVASGSGECMSLCLNTLTADVQAVASTTKLQQMVTLHLYETSSHLLNSIQVTVGML